MPNLTTNKAALHDYTVIEKFEAGIALTGPEVKSIKAGQINLKGSYVSIDQNDQVWLNHSHISAYKPAAIKTESWPADRTRRLLLRQKEINYLRGKIKEKGLTILPISVYTKGSLIKLEIGLVKGKKQFDKRADIKKREINREISRRLANK